MQTKQFIPDIQMNMHLAHKARRTRQAYQVSQYRVRKGMGKALRLMASQIQSRPSKSDESMNANDSLETASEPLRILYSVLKKHDLSKRELKSNTRRREIVLARHEICYLMTKAGYSLSHIASLIGKSDHTTALNGFRKYERLMRIKRGEKHLMKFGDKKVNWELIL